MNHFIIIGAQKAGTTSLHKYLSDHPDVYMAKEKEVDFFSRDDYYSKGINWYFGTYFPTCERMDALVSGEASPQYMYVDGVAKRIKNLLPTVKIIAILRNPIDRAYSHYRMSVKRGVEVRSFERVVDDFLSDKHQLVDVENFGYFHNSLYGKILSEYYSSFGKESIKIFFTEHLENDPLSVLYEINDFSDIDHNFVSPNVGRKFNEGGERKFKFIDVIKNKPFIKKIARMILSERIRQRLALALEFWNTRPVEDLGPSPAIRQALAIKLSADVKLLQQLASIEVPWKDYRPN